MSAKGPCLPSGRRRSFTLKSPSRERKPGDKSDLEVIDGKVNADIRNSSTKTPETVLRNNGSSQEIPRITVSSPEATSATSQGRLNDAASQVKADDTESSPSPTPAETSPPEGDVVEQLSNNSGAPAEPLRWDNLWEDAYKSLKANEEYAKLLEDLELHLLDGRDGVENGQDSPKLRDLPVLES